MSSIQLIINRIHLPKELLNIIKDFCFYDIPTAIMRQFIMRQKQEICRIFNYESCSRFHPFPYYEMDENPDTVEHWVFCIDSEYILQYSDPPMHLQLQAENCSKCGNYSHYSHGANKYTICVCV